MSNTIQQTMAFKAETRQLLDILIHSLYTERDVFLRELISNASDALTRLNFEMLTQRNVLDAEAELGIWITTNAEDHTLTIRDTGIGMTQEEMVENLGTIAHSGARSFIETVQQDKSKLSDLIGQFGVGFYSAFMVAESIEVASRSYRLEAQAARWVSMGSDTYTLEASDKTDRGTVVTIKLNADSVEFAQEHRLRAIISKHSDYIPFPIYVGKDAEPVNRQMALWRKSPREVEKAQYDDFYKQLTLDAQPPLMHTHMTVDAPVQMYALVYVPSSAERNVFSSRRQDGLKLYARKVLIQDYCKDMLPEYLRFVQGVVDSEDLPLNVSRESVQSTRVMAQLKKLVTGRILETLKSLAQEKPEEYEKFWKAFGRYIKEGLAMSEYENESALLELLRFATLKQPGKLVSLAEYVQAMKVDQTKIYYIVGDDDRSIIHSPHLEAIRSYGYDVLLLTDPLDPFILLKVNQYKELPLVNVSSEDLKPVAGGEQDQEKSEALPESDLNKVVEWFRHQLGEKVTGVRSTESLVESPARLVDEQGAMTPEMQHVYRLLDKQYDVPKKVLEINPRHPLLLNLNVLTEENPLTALIIDQIYEDALLIEGLLPDPANMIPRLQKIMEAALTKQA